MTATTPDLAGFESTYRRHVAMVVEGDLKGVLADMDPQALPQVFEGVTVPRTGVSAAEVRTVRVEGSRAVGEAIYRTSRATIALRSGWSYDGSAWLADRLENFDPADGS